MNTNIESLRNSSVGVTLTVLTIFLAVPGCLPSGSGPGGTLAAADRNGKAGGKYAPDCGPNGELCICGTEDGTGCAPSSARVDLYEPTFSNPTNIDNPLFSITKIDQTILLGHVDGVAFRVEYTLLPKTRAITWKGEPIETAQVQYVAQLDGRIEEVALDSYAQADDGSVWYFGEEVADYVDGVVVSTADSWLVERDGPLAMIMPADPQVGDVYRVENIPGRVFEELTVVAVDLTLEGPSGLVEGAMHVQELGLHGTYSFKTFAPGYAEFLTAKSSALEALALAVPTDAVPGPAPTELETIVNGAAAVFEAAPARDCGALAATMSAMNAAWQTYAALELPPRLATNLDDALGSLSGALARCNSQELRQDAIAVSVAALDFQLRHLPPTKVDVRRFDVWLRQLLLDAATGETGGAKSDAILLTLTRDRFAHTLPGAAVARIDAELATLRAATEAEDLAAAAGSADRLRAILTVFGATN